MRLQSEYKRTRWPNFSTWLHQTSCTQEQRSKIIKWSWSTYPTQSKCPRNRQQSTNRLTLTLNQATSSMGHWQMLGCIKTIYRMCPLFWEDLASSFTTIQTILIVTGTSPKLLKLQEYPIGCLDIEEKTIKNIYCDKYIATLLHTFFENFR